MAGGPSKPAAERRTRLVRITSSGGEVPGPIRRLRRRLGISIAVGLVFVVAFAILQLLDLVSGDGHALLFAFFILTLAASIFCDIASRRVINRAAAHDYLVCPGCTYQLRDLGETGTCPECGRAYERAAVRALWVDAEGRIRNK